MDVSGEVEMITDVAEEHWTDEVKAAYAAHVENTGPGGPAG